MLNSLIYIVSAVASPLLGAGIDLFGRNLYWVLGSVVLTLVCHLCFAFTAAPAGAMVITVLMGLAYSILAGSLWPLVAMLMPPHHRATAYGLLLSAQNLGVGVISILAGLLVDSKVCKCVWVYVTLR